MSNSCNTLSFKPIKISELAKYASLKSSDIILITEKDGVNLYSRKTTFSDFVNSITQLTSSLSGNVKGIIYGTINSNVTGNLTGSVNGSFNGKLLNTTGSITGIPFKTLNEHDVSFDGTTSYSVSSSYSETSSYSKNSQNSNYALTSSYSYTNYVLNCNNSIYSSTSSLSNLSLISSQSHLAYNTKNSYSSSYVDNGLLVNTSSYSLFSNFNKSSSYALTSNYAKSSSFSVKSNTSSYSQISAYSSTFYPVDFDMVYITSFDDDSTEASNRINANCVVYDGGGGQFNWRKIILSKSFSTPCGEDSLNGKLPPYIEYVYLGFRFINRESNQDDAVLFYSPDPYDGSQPKIFIDFSNVWATDANVTDYKYLKTLLLPIKSDKTGSFYYKIPKNYNDHDIYLIGYIRPRKCT